MSSQQLDTLTAAITSDRAPFCSGVLNPSAQSFILYFGVENPHRINLANASPEALEELSTACDAATFGVGGENVLDESYRKAGKLDNTSFSTPFDPIRLGLIETIRSHLLDGHDEKKSIDVELYKLNVYGEGSFFKPHKDTPRGANMFGSLVVIFPTPHEGGELMLRHQGQEWKFDPSSLMFHTGATSQGSGGTSEPQPAIKGPLISYISFYSDVEHEVLKVTSGSRVTITYNLYFSETNTDEPSAIVPSASNTTHLGLALTALLHDPTFLHDGGKLGFGLTHQYPISKGTKLARLIECLKGADAIIHRASTGLGLATSLKMVYSISGTPQVMMDKVVNMNGLNFYDNDPSRIFIRWGGVAINRASGDGDNDYEDYLKHETITWVTDLTKMNEMKSAVMTYGNEAAMDFVYGDLCLFVSVGPFDHRATA